MIIEGITNYNEFDLGVSVHQMDIEVVLENLDCLALERLASAIPPQHLESSKSDRHIRSAGRVQML